MRGDVYFIINTKEETWKITRQTVQLLQRCNHEGADYRMVFHAGKTQSKAVIVAKDSDVLTLLLYAMTLTTEANWLMKIDTSEYVDVRTINDHFGYDISCTLLQFHAITGCDTLYRFLTVKLKVFKKIVRNSSHLNMIQSLGQVESLTDEVIEVVKRFIQTIIYNGSLNESFVESRVRFYKNLKKKTSAAIPADPDSTLQEIKRVHLQSFIWLRCLDPIIPILDVRQFGWTCFQ